MLPFESTRNRWSLMSINTPNELLNEPDKVRRPARLALYLGGALIVIGLVAIYLGYDGAAKNPLTQAQIPYVISGGLLGLALVGVGAVTLAVYVLLHVQGDLRTELAGMRRSMEALSETIARSALGGVAHPGSPSSNGTVMVAKGASSYHRADCRLVTRAEAVTPLPRAEADNAGLVPCRICKP